MFLSKMSKMLLWRSLAFSFQKLGHLVKLRHFNLILAWWLRPKDRWIVSLTGQFLFYFSLIEIVLCYWLSSLELTSAYLSIGLAFCCLVSYLESVHCLSFTILPSLSSIHIVPWLSFLQLLMHSLVSTLKSTSTHTLPRIQCHLKPQLCLLIG